MLSNFKIKEDVMKRIALSTLLMIAVLGFASPAWTGNELLQAEPALQAHRRVRS